MSQVKVRVLKAGKVVAQITYSPEYGVTSMAEVGFEIETEETDLRMVPVLDLPQDPWLGHRPPNLSIVDHPDIDLTGIPAEALVSTADRQKLMSEQDEMPNCFTCGHPPHVGYECTLPVLGPGAEPGRECGCAMYLA